MKGDDDAEEDKNVSIGVSRYPCMPSLVALQQMRNRLHLAHLGRKLMKWTAMATGREERKVASDLYKVYDNFRDDMKNAYMLLARARYFYPNLNKMVIENPPQVATVTVDCNIKSVSGVRVLEFEVVESGEDAYAHLGIEKGGQAISEAKAVWLALLKRLLLMLQLRIEFTMLDCANRAATKKMNVLSKMIVPRIQSTIRYILLELEERAREDFARLKKVVQKKQRDRKKKESQIAPHSATHIKESEEMKLHGGICSTCSPELVFEPEIKSQAEEKITDELNPICSTCSPIPESEKYDEKFETVSLREVYIPVCCIKDYEDAKSDEIKMPGFRDSEFGTDAVDEKFEVTDIKTNFEREISETSNPVSVEAKTNLERLNSYIDQVAKMAENFKGTGFIVPGLEEFLKSCKRIKIKMDTCMKGIVDSYKANSNDTKKDFSNFENIDDLKEDERKDFSCLKGKEVSNDVKLSEEHDIDQLITQLDEAMKLSKEAKKANLISDVDEFIEQCKGVKKEILRNEIPGILSQESQFLNAVNNVTKVDDVIELIAKYNSLGLVSKTFDEFMKSCNICERFGSELEFQEKFVCNEACTCNESTLMELCDGCLKYIMEETYEPNPSELPPPPCNFCREETKEKLRETCSNPSNLQNSDVKSPHDSKKRTDSILFEELNTPECDKKNKVANNNEGYNRHKISEKNTNSYYQECNELDHSQDFNKLEFDRKKENNDHKQLIQCDKNELIEKLDKFHSDSNVTNNEIETNVRQEEQLPSNEESISLGYYERKIRKIIRVTRSKNEDGTISEEKETITIKSEKREPDNTGPLTDDELDEKNSEVTHKNDEQRIAHLTDPEQNQRGFMRIRAKSETTRRIQIAGPILRQCVSAEASVPTREELIRVVFPTDSVETAAAAERVGSNVTETHLSSHQTAKVIIPKIHLTIQYIISELEEISREEFFRLKRVKQNKAKKSQVKSEHVCCCCKALFDQDDDIYLEETICPLCSKAAKSFPSKPASSRTVFDKEDRNDERINQLKTHIDEVIKMSERYKLEGIVPPEIDNFIRSCVKAKDEIITSNRGSSMKIVEKASSHKSFSEPIQPLTCLRPCYEKTDRPKEEPPPGSHIDINEIQEFGYFEKKYEEIVKVTRFQNPDGTIREEKQIITVKTERKNPRSGVQEGESDEKFIGSCYGNDDDGGYGGGGRGGGGGSFMPGGGESDTNFRTRGIKSEASNQRSRDPHLRSCLSGGNKDLSICESGEKMSKKTPRVTLPQKVSKASSVDSCICGDKNNGSVCSSLTGSVVNDETEPLCCKIVSRSASAQSCFQEPSKKMPSSNRSTQCMTSCDKEVCKGLIASSTSTDALWRDVWTSTTDLDCVPSKAPSRKRSERSSPTPSVGGETKMNKSSSCCNIKIVPKAAKVCPLCDQTESEEPPNICLRGSLFDALRKILLPASKTSNDNCMSQPSINTEQNNPICRSCTSKLSSFMSSQTQKSDQICKMCQKDLEGDTRKDTSACPSSKSVCKMCQAEITSQNDNVSCSGVSKTESCTSCRSTAVGSGSLSCPPSPKRRPSRDSVKSAKTCYSYGNVSLSKSVCCSVKKQSKSSCPSMRASKSSCPKSVCSAESQRSMSTSCCEKVDASTCTKRSDRYDVRPVASRRRSSSIPRIRIRGDACCCNSDSYLNRRKSKKPVRNCKSMYEYNDYFRW